MLDGDQLRQIDDAIRQEYLSESAPWIIGYSGGKNSTAVLQMVWYALRELPEERRIREIHVLSNDTLVENPRIAEYVDSQLDAIRDALLGNPFIPAPRAAE